jgi:tRNA-2-methylthio-N6-dimethylallyladenosine synthase
MNTTTENIITALAPAPADSPARKVHIETWGCQMNVADSERMLSLLAERNYTLTQTVEDADLVLLNTCHIREKARHKVLSRLGVLRDLKESHPKMKIAVAGCVAQADGEKLIKMAPQIDILFGPGKIDELPRLLDEQTRTKKRSFAVGFKKDRGDHKETASSPTSADFTITPTLTGKNEVSRYLNIQQGCNNFCTFCVVPFTRGREISRTPEDILRESAGLLSGGARELTILGQNVNSYGRDLVQNGTLPATAEGPFVDLLRRLVALPRLERLRFTTSNPHDLSEDLAKLFAESTKLGKYIHLPVQSGNDEILERMRRKVTVAQYEERIKWLRQAVPDIAISTDLIVGFPGETLAQFEDTMALVERTEFSFIFSFKYSPRRGTAAMRFKEQISETEKETRLARLSELQDKITLKLNKNEIGKTRDVLFLYESRKDPGYFYGRTEHYRLVRIAAKRNIVGECLPVYIESANKTALAGQLAQA